MKKKIKSPRKPMTLDEVIVIPKFDTDNMTLDEMRILQDVLAKKTKQEEMKRECQQRFVLHKVKDICIDAFDIQGINEKAPLIHQLVHIFEKVNNDDIEANEKFLHWSKKKFEKEVDGMKEQYKSMGFYGFDGIFYVRIERPFTIMLCINL